MRTVLLALLLNFATLFPALARDHYIKMTSNRPERQYILVAPSPAKAQPVPLIVCCAARSEPAARGRSVRVGAYWVRGGGHTWPPPDGQLGRRNGPPTKNLDATRAIVEFFLGKG